MISASVIITRIKTAKQEAKDIYTNNPDQKLTFTIELLEDGTIIKTGDFPCKADHLTYNKYLKNNGEKLMIFRLDRDYHPICYIDKNEPVEFQYYSIDILTEDQIKRWLKKQIDKRMHLRYTLADRTKIDRQNIGARVDYIQDAIVNPSENSLKKSLGQIKALQKELRVLDKEIRSQGEKDFPLKYNKWAKL